MNLRKIIWRTILISIVVLCIGIPAAFIYSTPQVRVDCGDIRYTFIGIPVRYARTMSPQRESLLSLAKEARIKPDWVRVVRRTTSNSPVGTYELYYHAIVEWAAQDRSLGQILLQDVSKKILDAGGEDLAKPDSFKFLFDAEPDGVSPDWPMNPRIRDYGRSHGYVRPEWQEDEGYENAFDAYQSAINGGISPETREVSALQLTMQQRTWLYARLLSEIPEPNTLVAKEDLQSTSDTLRVLGDIGDAQTAEKLSQSIRDGPRLPNKIKAEISAAIGEIQARQGKPGN